MKKSFYLILLILFCVLNLGQGSWGLTESSEARYAEIGREMAISNNYLHPSLLNIGHYHKPPITYAITAIGYKIFGFNEYGARFFLSVALLLQIILIYKIVLLWFKDEKVAIASALIYFSFPIVLIAARNLTTDIYLNTFIIWSIYFWLQFKLKEKKIRLYLFYIVLGLAFLTKGPVALLPVMLFVICYKIINKEKPAFSIHSVLGLITLVIVSGSWFALIIYHKPELWDYFVQEQIINRSINAETFHRAKPFWFYALIAPALALPWIVPVVITICKKRKTLQVDKPSKVAGFTALSILITFSLFSSKLLLYILPLYPFLAMYFGSIFINHSRTDKIEYFYVFIVSLSILLVAVLVFPFIPQLDFSWFSSISLLLGILAFGYVMIYRFKANPTTQSLYLITGTLCFLVLIYTAFSSQNSFIINALKPEYTFINKQRTNEDYKVLVYDNLLSSAPFYLGEQVITIYDSNFEAQRDIRFETTQKWKENYLPINESGQLERFKSLMKDTNNVLLIKNKKKLADSLTYLLKDFKSQKFKKWTVYY